jgi:hypothetical protein
MAIPQHKFVGNMTPAECANMHTLIRRVITQERSHLHIRPAITSILQWPSPGFQNNMFRKKDPLGSSNGRTQDSRPSSQSAPLVLVEVVWTHHHSPECLAAGVIPAHRVWSPIVNDSSVVRHQRVGGEGSGVAAPRERVGSLLHSIRFREQGDA